KKETRMKRGVDSRYHMPCSSILPITILSISQSSLHFHSTLRSFRLRGSDNEWPIILVFLLTHSMK
ncbi:hypothetical protein PFISCL1PPCAC_21806, partial [Pristionchus fissidentatus]